MLTHQQGQHEILLTVTDEAAVEVVPQCISQGLDGETLILFREPRDLLAVPYVAGGSDVVAQKEGFAVNAGGVGIGMGLLEAHRPLPGFAGLHRKRRVIVAQEGGELQPNRQCLRRPGITLSYLEDEALAGVGGNRQ